MRQRLHFSHMIAETMALKDEPREPMTCHMRVRVSGRLAEVPLEKWKAATAFLLSAVPRLTMNFALSESGYSWQPNTNGTLDGFVECVWSNQDDSLEEFRALVFQPSYGPLVKFRFNPIDGFYATWHHCLSDGKAMRDLIGVLFAFILAENEGESRHAAQAYLESVTSLESQTLKPAVGIPRWRWVRELFERLFVAHLAPPRFTGLVKDRFGSRHFFVIADLEAQRVQRMIAGARTVDASITWNDIVLTAYHRALNAQTKKARFGWPWMKNRTGVLVSVNLRQWLPISELVCNWSSYYSSSSYEHLANGPLASHVRMISRQMKRKKRGLGAFSMIRTMELAERAGLFAKSRRHRLQTGQPLRIVNGREQTSGWRYFDTAILSNLGPVPVDFPGYGDIQGFYALAPVLPPAGIAMGVFGSGAGQHFFLQASDASLSESGCEKLMSDLFQQLDAFAALA